MDQPFDLKDLEARLKGNGLPAAEGLAKVVVSDVFDWLQDSLKAKGNLLFMIGIPVLSAIKPLALNELDKIDGVEGN